MKALSFLRVGLLLLLIVSLSVYAYIAVTKYVDSPIGIKESLETPTTANIFPAVTVCPFPDQGVNSIAFFARKSAQILPPKQARDAIIYYIQYCEISCLA